MLQLHAHICASILFISSLHSPLSTLFPLTHVRVAFASTAELQRDLRAGARGILDKRRVDIDAVRSNESGGTGANSREAGEGCVPVANGKDKG